MNARIIALICGGLSAASNFYCLAGIEPVSVAGAAQAASASGNGLSTTPEMSPDGRFVVFTSFANNLTTNDYNYYSDVFLRDRQSGITTLISATPDGPTGNAYSGSPSMSTNGAWVAFESDASDLVGGDTNQTTDVFVRNTALGLTALVSVNTNGTSANKASTYPITTPDGRFVAFESTATDLVTNDVGNKLFNVYVRDLANNTTVLASIGTNGLSSTDRDCKLSSVSSDGRYVLFQSFPKFYSFSENSGDIFIRDMQTRQTTWVNSNITQLLANSIKFSNPVMSGDGQCIAFRAIKASSCLVVRHDMSSGTSLVISSNQSVPFIANADYPGPTISQDGSAVAYIDFTPVPGSSYMMIKQISVWDAASQTNKLVTVAPDGTTPGDTNSISPVLSADGRTWHS